MAQLGVSKAAKMVLFEGNVSYNAVLQEYIVLQYVLTFIQFQPHTEMTLILL